ncbi:MAG TPA: DUF1259 domain-containing protein [Nitrososphaera sp.]|jgi:hypothetical protein|nr:DUF1259 domain-containing protein [Nitrososphaera sp.]
MTNSSSLLKTTLVMTTIAALTTLGFLTSTPAGMVAVQAQSTAATQSSQSTPPTPKEQPDVAQQFTWNPTSLPPTNVEECVGYAKILVGKAIPDYNMCDLVVYRQAPVVARSDGMVMNNFSGMGHYIELIPAAQILNETQAFGGGSTTAANASTANGTAQTTGANNTSAQNNNNTVVAFGEFALIDPEVVPVNEVLDKYNWTVTTIHNHMLDESPKLLFMHWTVTGNPDEIVQQAREAIMQTSSYATVTDPNAGTNATRPGTPSSAGP